MRSTHRSVAGAAGFLVALTGVVAGVAAAAGVGPFSALVVSNAVAVVATATPRPLTASTLYPPPTNPPPTQRLVVEPYPEQEGPPAPAEPYASPSTTAATPLPTACWEDDCSSAGGGDDGGWGGGSGGGDH
jgi:hypothetical protein